MEKARRHTGYLLRRGANLKIRRRGQPGFSAFITGRILFKLLTGHIHRAMQMPVVIERLEVTRYFRGRCLPTRQFPQDNTLFQRAYRFFINIL